MLDVLAAEFRAGAADKSLKPWSTRHLLRLIVTSVTNRRASEVRPELAAIDPDNRLLGRFPRRRLTAEILA